MDAAATAPPQRLTDIVASCSPWCRARLSTILVWPTLHGGWTAILSYAHYTTLRPGETPAPDDNVTYPHDTYHPVPFDGADVAVVEAQVRDLERTGAGWSSTRTAVVCRLPTRAGAPHTP